MCLYLPPDFEAHPVFVHFQCSAISFSGVGHQAGSVEGDDAGINRQLRFLLTENPPVPQRW
jgi:hypothetical protein